MADKLDGSQSPHDVGTPRGVNNSGPMNASIAGGRLSSVAPTSTGQAMITSVNAPPGISPDAFQQCDGTVRLQRPTVILDVPTNARGLRVWVVWKAPSGNNQEFRELTQAFSQQFLGNIQRRKSLALLATHKQGKNESLKDYLKRFSQEVSGIRNPNDKVMVAAFTNNLEKGRLSFDLRRESPNTYTDIMDVAGSYAMAEEEELAQRGSYMHGGHPGENANVKNQMGDHHESDGNKDGRRDKNHRNNQNEKKFHGQYTNYTPLTNKQEEILAIVEYQKLVKYPSRQSTYARRDTTKYYMFLKESGHDTSKCYQLRDHIEKLIREGHLKDVILKRADEQQKVPLWDNQPRGNQNKKRRPGRDSGEWTISTIFCGPYTKKNLLLREIA
ncbi:hypothetical protein Dsin_001935 [Dipteronia sinensis]|uniref:Retrotransposon gag domain-containing protein n=1 Tax=Dipteronia sinensis TaxID=43782 RepID=A0AAE0B6B2_9ROSI|nr:hypothetical protein Dsin_001935 [Dipteronia sinensis]